MQQTRAQLLPPPLHPSPSPADELRHLEPRLSLSRYISTALRFTTPIHIPALHRRTLSIQMCMCVYVLGTTRMWGLQRAEEVCCERGKREEETGVPERWIPAFCIAAVAGFC